MRDRHGHGRRSRQVARVGDLHTIVTRVLHRRQLWAPGGNRSRCGVRDCAVPVAGRPDAQPERACGRWRYGGQRNSDAARCRHGKCEDERAIRCDGAVERIGGRGGGRRRCRAAKQIAERIAAGRHDHHRRRNKKRHEEPGNLHVALIGQ
jgi:hypothetical protein